MAGNAEIKSYRDLLIWQKGMALAKQVYAMTRAFPVLVIASLRGKLAARLATNH
jgi:hypothetical protein